MKRVLAFIELNYQKRLTVVGNNIDCRQQSARTFKFWNWRIVTYFRKTVQAHALVHRRDKELLQVTTHLLHEHKETEWSERQIFNVQIIQFSTELEAWHTQKRRQLVDFCQQRIALLVDFYRWRTSPLPRVDNWWRIDPGHCTHQGVLVRQTHWVFDIHITYAWRGEFRYLQSES